MRPLRYAPWSGSPGIVATVVIPPPEGDVTAPTFVSAVIGADGLTLTITYSEALDPASVPTLTLGGTASTVSSVNVTGSTVVGTLNTAVLQGASGITVSTSGSPVQDVAGNDAAALVAQAVTNNSAVTVAHALIFNGDSLMEGYDSTNTLGLRGPASFYTTTSGFNIDFVGQFSTGGVNIPDPDHCCQSGAGSATIQSNFNTALVTHSPSLGVVDMGINDVALVGTPGLTAAANNFTRLKAMQDAAMLENPAYQLIYMNLFPLPPAHAYAGQEAIYNNEWSKVGGYKDQFNALYPSNTMQIFDAYTALGGVWDNTLMGGDDLHPAEAGWAVLRTAFMAAFKSTLRGRRNAINALGCTITAPTAGATVTVGVPVSVTVTITRSPYDCTVAVKNTAGTTLGAAAAANPNVASYTYSWTPQAGDVGAFTLRATVTDTADSSTADAAGVAVTVATAANYATPETIVDDVTVVRDWWADTGTTEAGGVGTGVSSWVDRVAGGDAVQATLSKRPALTLVDATLNNRRSVAGDGISKEFRDAALNVPAPGTQPIWMHFVFMPIAWNASRNLFGANATSCAFGSLAGALANQQFVNNGAISGAALAVPGTWYRGEIYLSATNADYMKIGSTLVTTANATGFGTTDPAVGFSIFSSNLARWGNYALHRLILAYGLPAPAKRTSLDSAMSTYLNNVPVV